MSDPLQHSSIAHFRILAKLGEGGMGRVYKARDLNLQRIVALKFLSPALVQNHQALSRFHLEAVAASAINHPNICTIYEIDTEEPQHFIVMEYVEGKTLRALLDFHGKFSQRDVLWIMQQICPALALAHDAGIVHQDLKPENIMISENSGLVKLMDFGLARLAAETAELTAMDSPTFESAEFTLSPVTTAFSGMMGTAAYMSPEQVMRAPVDFRSDIFVMGNLIYELLTGQQLFPQQTLEQVLMAIVQFEPDSLQHAKLPSKWKPILQTCLQHEPLQRYTSTLALLQELEQIKQSRYSRPVLVTSEQPRQLRRKNYLAWIVPALLTFVLGGIFLFDTSFLTIFYPNQQQTFVSVNDPFVFTTSQNAYHFFKQGQQSWWRYANRDAIQQFQTAVDLDSTFLYAHALLGVLLNWQDRPKEARACFDVIERELGQINLQNQLFFKAFVHYQNNETDAMLKAFQNVLGSHPHHIDAHLMAALACEMNRDFDPAIQYMEKVIAIDSTHIAAYNNLADFYDWKTDYAQALVYAKKQLVCIQASGNMQGAESAYETIGLLHHLLGHSQEAEHFLKRSIEIDARNRDAAQYLAEVLALDGRLDEAEQVLQRAISLPMKNVSLGNTYYWLARLYVFAGRYSDAYETFERIRHIYPQDRIYATREHATVAMHAHHDALVQEDIEWLHRRGSIEQLQDSDDYHALRFQYALHGDRIEEAEQWLYESQYRFGSHLTDHFYPHIAKARGEIEHYEDLLLTRIQQKPDEAAGDRSSAYFNVAELGYNSKRYSEALLSCQSALRIRRILVYSGRGLTFAKAMNLLSKIYTAMGEHTLALRVCDQFLWYWADADPGLALLQEVQKRRDRLVGHRAMP